MTQPGLDDLGARLHTARLRRGMSLELLGGLCGVSGAYLSMVENGKRRLDRYSLIVALAEALNVVPTEIAPGMPAGGDTGDPVQDAPTAHIPTGASRSEEDATAVLARIDKLGDGLVDPQVIERVQVSVRQAVAEYENLDHSRLARDLLSRRASIEDALNRCTQPKQRRQLLEAAAIASGLLGYVAVGRSDFPLARAYCREAFQLGEFMQDLALQAWSRGLQSFCEYYAGRYDDAHSLATDGLKYSQSGPQSVRLLINGTARALGKLGDSDGVHRAVHQAHDLMALHNAPSGIPSSISFGCYSAAQTASNAATAYLSLGMPDKVQHYIGLAMPEVAKSRSPWSRSLVMIDLASSLIDPKEADLDRASTLMVDALTISSGRPIVSVQQRASEFLRRAADQWGDVRQVRAVREAASSLSA